MSGTDSLLWDRILNNFTDKFKERYIELRKEILDTDNLISRYKDFIESIPEECYEKDIELYPDTPQKDIDQIQQITEFLKLRTECLDKIIYELK